MKRIICLTGVLFALVSGYICCRKISGNYSDAVYITGADANPVTTLVVPPGTSATQGINISSSGLVTANVSATLRLAPELVSNYNLVNGTNYVPIPMGDCSLSDSAVLIPTGNNVSNTVDFSINSIADFKTGSVYMMPVTISGAVGQPVLASQKTTYIVITPEVIESVVNLQNYNYFTVDFSTNNAQLKSMTNITYICKINAASLDNAISSVMGIEGLFLLRFGDTNPLNVLELCTATNLTDPTPISTGVWHQLAAVGTPTSQSIYVDGVLAATNNTGVNVDLTSTNHGGFHFGYSYDGRPFDGQISECSVWSAALTPAQIQGYQCGIDPQSPGLVGYWRFNEGSGKISKDLSGNGHDAVSSSAPAWVQGVKCN